MQASSAGRVRVGSPVARSEDIRFVKGQSHFADDITMPNTAYAYIVRSPHAHARVVRIDKAAALAAPGVLMVLTGEDARQAKLGALPCRLFPPVSKDNPAHRPAFPILTDGKVRHVGDRVAMIVAETLDQAKDAAELIDVQYESLPPVVLENALAPDAAKVWDDASNNLCIQLLTGDRAAVDRAFEQAAHVTSLSVRYPRATASTIEPRAALAYFDATDGRCTLCTSSQAPFRVRECVSVVLGVPETYLRVISPDVGGSFGMKNQVYPEEILLVWAVQTLRRPIKWTADRSESFLSDTHGRDQITTAELALDDNGRMLGLRATTTINVGAYLGYSGGVPPSGATRSYSNVYALPAAYTTVRAVFTTTAPLGPYRGSGKPEASFVIERLVDKAAREMGIDPVVLRRRNLVDAKQMPHRTPGGQLYDSGDFHQVLDKALELADLPGFPARRRDSERCHRRRGLGLSMHCQQAGQASERMEIRVDPTGSVVLHVGTMASGQGHETMFALMVSDWLGVPFDRVSLVQGDTDRILFGRGTWSQRSTLIGGVALNGAAKEVIAKGAEIAGLMLDADPKDIDFDNGIFSVRGTNRSATFDEVAKQAYADGRAGRPGVGLHGAGHYEGPPSFPNGCMICEVEVDPETGRVEVQHLVAIDDVGVVINPLTLEGQVHGSIAQGLGEVLMEEVLYDPDTGQLICGSFMDYGLPRADHMPSIVSEAECVRSRTNPLGVKGGSEAGNVGAPAAIINAVIDALAPLGVRDIALPAKPEHVWRAIQNAGHGVRPTV